VANFKVAFNDFVFINRWIGDVNGQLTVVYAGYDQFDRQTGAILFRELDVYGEISSRDVWETFPGSGPLRMATLSDDKGVAAISESGALYTVDANAKTAEVRTDSNGLIDECCSVFLDLSDEPGIQTNWNPPIGSTVAASVLLGGNPGAVPTGILISSNQRSAPDGHARCQPTRARRTSIH
jgi:hypothetical protein